MDEKSQVQRRWQNAQPAVHGWDLEFCPRSAEMCPVFASVCTCSPPCVCFLVRLGQSGGLLISIVFIIPNVSSCHLASTRERNVGSFIQKSPTVLRVKTAVLGWCLLCTSAPCLLSSACNVHIIFVHCVLMHLITGETESNL